MTASGIPARTIYVVVHIDQDGEERVMLFSDKDKAEDAARKLNREFRIEVIILAPDAED